MICHTAKLTYNLGDVIRIRILADVHYGHKTCDVRALKEYLRVEDPNTYFVGNGDLLDSIVVKDSRRYRKSMDDTAGDDLLDEQINGMVALLEPVKEKILGLGTGNHEDAITRMCSTNPMKRLCGTLGVPFLGYSWLLRLSMVDKKGGRGRAVVIRGHHGWGGGSRTEGGSITKYAREAYHWDADIFLYGHDHRRLDGYRIPRLGLVGEKLVAKPKVVILCGTFKKTFSEGADPTWEESKGFPPSEIGCPIIMVRPDSNGWVTIDVE